MKLKNVRIGRQVQIKRNKTLDEVAARCGSHPFSDELQEYGDMLTIVAIDESDSTVRCEVKLAHDYIASVWYPIEVLRKYRA